MMGNFHFQGNGELPRGDPPYGRCGGKKGEEGGTHLGGRGSDLGLERKLREPLVLLLLQLRLPLLAA